MIPRLYLFQSDMQSTSNVEMEKEREIKSFLI